MGKPVIDFRKIPLSVFREIYDRKSEIKNLQKKDQLGNWLRRIIKSKANGGGINLSEASLSQVQKLANHFVEGSGLLIRTKTGYDVAPSYVDKIVLRFSVEAWDEAAKNTTETAVVAPTPVKEKVETKEAAPAPKPTETVPTTWKEFYSSVLEKLSEKEMNKQDFSEYLVTYFEKITGYTPKNKEEFLQRRLSALNKYLVEIDGEYLPTDPWKEEISHARGLHHQLFNKESVDESRYCKVVEEKKEVEKKQAPEPVKTDKVPTPTNAVQPPKQIVTPVSNSQMIVSSPQVVVEKRPIPCNIFVDKNKVNEIKSFIIETLYEDKGLVLVEVDLTKISLVRLAKVGAIVEDEDLSRLKSHFEKKRENALIEASFVNGLLGK